MSPIQAMTESSRRGPYDELYTPAGAVSHLVPHLPRGRVIWESAPGTGSLSDALRSHGFKVVAAQQDYFTWEPQEWDIQVTNPPFSKKAQWLQRANDLGKPWAILLPVTSLGSRACQVQLVGADILFLPKRIDFTGRRAPWFAVAWYTRDLRLPQQINFVDPRRVE